MNPWPTDIAYDPATKTLRVQFESGSAFDLPAEYLRVESPSAEVQGHGGDEKVIVPGRRHVGILDVEPVGNYAVKIVFDDTGLYSWQLLYDLGREYETRWQTYLAALAAKGLSREP